MNIKNRNIFFKIFVLLLIISSSIFANITGTVFRDYNSNGIQEILEANVSDINVTLYNDFGEVNSTLTDINGAYSFSGLSGDYRIEVTNLPSYLKPTTPLTLKVTASHSYNFGLNNPADYSEANPSIVVVKILKGSTDGENNDSATLVRYNYSDNNKTGATDIITFGKVGSVYGVAHSKRNGVTYLSSYFKRHTGVKPDGIASIYKVDNANTVTEFTNEHGTDPRSSEGNDYNWSRDINSYEKVGKIGFGDIELSDDETQLFAVNLEDRELYVYDLDTDGSKVASTKYFIPNPCENNNTDDFRPMGLGFNDGILYVGTTCTAESTVLPNDDDKSWLGKRMGDRTKLSAHIYTFNLSTNMFSSSSILDIPLDYGRGVIYDGDISTSVKQKDRTDNKKVTDENRPFRANWLPWQMDAEIVFANKAPYDMQKDDRWVEYPQPILSDIAFDNDDAMIIGIRDINGDRGGYKNFSLNLADTNLSAVGAIGDILRACRNSTDVWILENNGKCGKVTTAGVDNHEGFNGGEYYYQDNGPGGLGSINNSSSGHGDTTMGALLQVAGYPDVVSSTMDTHETYDNGLVWLNNHTGEVAKEANGTSRKLEVSAKATDDKKFGKASGLGDIELLSAPAPIEIGNYVWDDNNSNGIQEPSENGLGGITVALFQGETRLETTTDSNGYYYFNNLKSNTEYQLRVDLDDVSSKVPTRQNVGSNDERDSDGDNGALNTGFSTIAYRTGGAGENNHSLDFGFTENLKYTLGDYVWRDDNRDGLQDSNESGVNGIKVNLYRTTDCTGEINATVTTANGGTPSRNGFYQFRELTAGDYCIEFTNLPTNYSISPADSGTDDSNNSDVNGEAKIEDIALSSDDANEDMGIYPNATNTTTKYKLGNYVWEDINGNGIQDADEHGVKDVNITLYHTTDCTGDILAEATSATNGSYLFSNLEEGNYCLLFSNIPTGYAITKQSVGEGTAQNNSDANSNGQITDILLTTHDLNQDVGLVRSVEKASIGDFVWWDNNVNGVQDNNETGVPNIKVTLFQSCNSDTPNEIATQQTDDNGKYLFADLDAGSYCLKFSDIPDLSNITLQDTHNTTDNNDSDVNPSTAKTIATNLLAGEIDMSWDMGIYRLSVSPVTPTPTATNPPVFPTDPPAVPIDVPTVAPRPSVTPIPTRTPRPIVGSSSTVTPTPTRTPTPSGVPTSEPTVGQSPTPVHIGEGKLVLGDRVWSDNNKNGIQDANENGVKDVKVTLYGTNDCTGDVLGTTETNSNGKYMFDGLDAGAYCVIFTNLPSDYKITTKDIGADDNNSDANIDGKIENINLISNDLDEDMGIYNDVVCEVSKVYDRSVEANKRDATTVIDVFGDDSVAIETQDISLLTTEDGQALYQEGRAISTANLNKFQTLRVEGEGVWEVNGGKIYFIAQDGFDGVPTAIYYIVEQSRGCKEILGLQNDLSEIGEVKINTPCVCNTYETVAKSSVAFSKAYMLIILLLISFAFILFLRKEKLA